MKEYTTYLTGLSNSQKVFYSVVKDIFIQIKFRRMSIFVNVKKTPVSSKTET